MGKIIIKLAVQGNLSYRKGRQSGKGEDSRQRTNDSGFNKEKKIASARNRRIYIIYKRGGASTRTIIRTHLHLWDGTDGRTEKAVKGTAGVVRINPGEKNWRKRMVM